MSKKLQNIYIHLINNRKASLFGWYNDYKRMTGDVRTLEKEIQKPQDLLDASNYFNTSYKLKKDANENDPYYGFIKDLVYKKANGVSSRGQSTLSWENFLRFRNDPGFQKVIFDAIKDPSRTTYMALEKWWGDQKVGNNPVLVNRVLAASTTTVSTTVDNGKFHQVLKWLRNHNLIAEYDQQEEDWFSINQYVVAEISKGLAGLFNDQKIVIDEYWIGLFYWELYRNLASPFSLNKQLVKYGAPGTGKTYSAKEITRLQFEFWKGEIEEKSTLKYDELNEVVQFHPSFSYEDFIEGLRPTIDEEGKTQLSLQNGVFKNLCKKAGKWEKDLAELGLVTNNAQFDNLEIKQILDHKDELHGEHWDYIWQLPDTTRKVSEILPPYFLIIDEVNRAELSRVFGELMYCLEYRGFEGKIKTQYAHLNNRKTGIIEVAGEFQFFVPNNLFIIATMNTIDRSVESFDFALRRRFRWEEVKPDIAVLKYHLQENYKQWSDLALNLKNLNKKIKDEPLLGRDYCIGHAYLWKLNYPVKLSLSEVRKLVWKDSIKPLVQEYLRGTGKEGELLPDLENSFSKK